MLVPDIVFMLGFLSKYRLKPTFQLLVLQRNDYEGNGEAYNEDLFMKLTYEKKSKQVSLL